MWRFPPANEILLVKKRKERADGLSSPCFMLISIVRVDLAREEVLSHEKKLNKESRIGNERAHSQDYSS